MVRIVTRGVSRKQKREKNVDVDVDGALTGSVSDGELMFDPVGSGDASDGSVPIPVDALVSERMAGLEHDAFRLQHDRVGATLDEDRSAVGLVEPVVGDDRVRRLSLCCTEPRIVHVAGDIGDALSDRTQAGDGYDE